MLHITTNNLFFADALHILLECKKQKKNLIVLNLICWQDTRNE